MNNSKWLSQSIDPRMFERDACGVGLVADLKNRSSRRIVSDALQMLDRMEHRGGLAADGQTSDGVGLSLAIPHDFFQTLLTNEGQPELASGKYAVANLMLDPACSFSVLKQTSDKIANSCGLSIRLWRQVPCLSAVLGRLARKLEPRHVQSVVSAIGSGVDGSELKRRLFTFRRRLEAKFNLEKSATIYFSSISTSHIVYKGLMRASHIGDYYCDLKDENFRSSFALLHQRFSTNTASKWQLAQPFRSICHNGEINTLRGNLSAAHSVSSSLDKNSRKRLLGEHGEIIDRSGSDSACLDQMIDFLSLTSRSMPEIVSSLIPPAWQNNDSLSERRRAFHEYQALDFEPWDGPAFVGFVDENYVGAALDRNGLRPASYMITKDDKLIVASEAGLLDTAPKNIQATGRLGPGEMIAFDYKNLSLKFDQELKDQLAKQKSYRAMLQQRLVPLKKEYSKLGTISLPLDQSLGAFAYTKEDCEHLLLPMSQTAKEPIGSMGHDLALAMLSEREPLLFDYFHQIFAQVTNPPIDAIREKLVTSLDVYLGARSDLFKQESMAARIKLSSPVIDRLTFAALLSQKKLSVSSIQASYNSQNQSLAHGLNAFIKAGIRAVKDGASILLIDDRLGNDLNERAIPSLLAVSSLHHQLLRLGLRRKCSLISTSGEPRTVHHFACLVGYGADAVYPYLALELIEDGRYLKTDRQTKAAGVKLWINAVDDGLRKIMSKMGVSCLQSYAGAQLFSVMGISKNLVDQHFCWTESYCGGLNLSDLDRLVERRHARFRSQPSLVSDGSYAWRKDGERRLHTPEMIAGIQQSSAIRNQEQFKVVCETIDQPKAAINLRQLLKFKKNRHTTIPVAESRHEIMLRFTTGAMSLGSISKEAHESIAIAMNRIGARSNSGEGGEDSARLISEANGDLKASAIRQIASGRFGVTIEYLSAARELQIKIAQGAKPGEGGQLPGHKVDQAIAKLRHSSPGVSLISPPPHHDIYSIEDLSQLIYDLKSANPQAMISVKLVSSPGVGTIAAGVAKAGADLILISGHEGGTGASPLSSLKHAGLPWEIGLKDAHDKLVMHGLRKRVILQVDGGIRTAKDVLLATALGAEQYGFGTGALIVLGCIMMRKCHLNTCPVGIATQDPRLRSLFKGQPDHLVNYFTMLAEEVRLGLQSLGLESLKQLVGRSDLLQASELAKRYPHVSLRLFLKSDQSNCNQFASDSQNHGLEKRFDQRVLLPQLLSALKNQQKVQMSALVKNTDRAIGTSLSGFIARSPLNNVIGDGHFQLSFSGFAGQSFMAFGAKGVTARLGGFANDYCAKGLSGAIVAIRPPLKHLNTSLLAGNTCLYGATSGALYIGGKVGQRFAVRNSGAEAVVEGVGDHGLEYMTGGSVVILGPVGRNLAAGMSGGQAFIYEPLAPSLKRSINFELVKFNQSISRDISDHLYRLLRNFLYFTGSSIAEEILGDWPRSKKHFVHLVPKSSEVLEDSKVKRSKVFTPHRHKSQKRLSQPTQENIHG